MLRNELSLDAVARGVERRGKSSQATLAGRNGDDPTADATFSRQPDVVKPVAGGLVQSRRCHNSKYVMTDDWIDDSYLGDRIHPAISGRTFRLGSERLLPLSNIS